MHGVGQVGDELAQLRVEVDDGGGRGAQHRVAHDPDGGDAHRTIVGAAPRAAAGRRRYGALVTPITAHHARALVSSTVDGLSVGLAEAALDHPARSPARRRLYLAAGTAATFDAAVQELPALRLAVRGVEPEPVSPGELANWLDHGLVTGAWGLAVTVADAPLAGCCGGAAPGVRTCCSGWPWAWPPPPRPCRPGGGRPPCAPSPTRGRRPWTTSSRRCWTPPPVDVGPRAGARRPPSRGSPRACEG
ncbi:putative polypeptide deformylase [Modestobacter italicus]|uniref:Polypeptide deformylase n=1 Tax=Modestobacter italicus (strain DSM 44449 / CECT 9708 / BC 501) TaxID=2732864 RepID=I4EZA8_MODI5|nr:putative polypeptide deformylase [Modestobacter marinus]